MDGVKVNTYELALKALIGSLKQDIHILEINLRNLSGNEDYMRGYYMGNKTALEGVLRTLEGEG